MPFRCIVTTVAAALAGMAIGVATPAGASVLDEWSGIKLPPPPKVSAVTIDPKTTALLMLDFMNQNCGKRERCRATVPAVQKLLAEARKHNMAVVYTLIAKTTTADVMKEVAPQVGDPSVLSGPDKFVGTNLDEILKKRGIRTVIAVGTSSHGAVLYTASGAVMRGMRAIVPVDGMSSDSAFIDMLAISVLTTAPRVSGAVTLTKLDMIKF